MSKAARREPPPASDFHALRRCAARKLVYTRRGPCTGSASLSAPRIRRRLQHERPYARLSAARSGGNPLTYRRHGALPANPGMQTPLELTCGSNTSEVMEQSSFLSDVGSFSSVPGPFYIGLKSLGCHFAKKRKRKEKLPNFQF